MSSRTTLVSYETNCGYVYLSAVSLELLSKYFSWCNYRIGVGVHRSLQAALLLVAGSWSW